MYRDWGLIIPFDVNDVVDIFSEVVGHLLEVVLVTVAFLLQDVE